MSLAGFHVDANVTEAALIAQSSTILDRLTAGFRQVAANGFSFGGLTLQDGDLNRLHAIVTEIDTRRVFYSAGEDEVPAHAMTSLRAVRDLVRDKSRGIWADPSCERLVQEISAALADCCTQAERLERAVVWSSEARHFMDTVTEMRLRVWVVVAILQRKIGQILQPGHLPPEIAALVASHDV